MATQKKLLNCLLLLSFSFGYLEWGSNSSTFIFQAAFQFFSKLPNEPLSLLHPFILIPLTGIILILITFFQASPSRMLTLAGLTGMALLMLFIFFIGLISLNYKIILSALPFLVIAAVIIIGMRKKKITST